MLFYGYCIGSTEESPLSLGEVTIAASPVVLRLIAKFLNHVADQMEKRGASFGHEHLQDFDRRLPSSPAFIVSSPAERAGDRKISK